MLATTCTVCGTPLVLRRETYDAEARVYVGSLDCPRCRRRYLDTRRPVEGRSEVEPWLPLEDETP